MNYDDFFEEAKKNRICINFTNSSETVSHKLSNEALFHLPLLAMTILLLSKAQRKPKREELGQLVGECFERTFDGFKGSSQFLGWSANLRMRTVKALTFLETADLVCINQSDLRIKVSEKGRKVISKAVDGDSKLALTLKKIERNYTNIEVEKQISMGIT